MSDLTIQRGDYGFYIQGTLTNSDASAFNLTGYSLTLQAWELGKPNHPIVSGTASAVVATQGTWRYLVAQNDFITEGEFLINVRATKSGARETAQNYTVEVKESP